MHAQGDSPATLRSHWNRKCFCPPVALSSPGAPRQAHSRAELTQHLRLPTACIERWRDPPGNNARSCSDSLASHLICTHCIVLLLDPLLEGIMAALMSSSQILSSRSLVARCPTARRTKVRCHIACSFDQHHARQEILAQLSRLISARDQGANCQRAASAASVHADVHSPRQVPLVDTGI